MSKWLPFINELIKSQGLTITVILVITGFLMYDKHQTDTRNLQRIDHLESEIKELNEWRITQLTDERGLLLDALRENTLVLSDIKLVISKK